MSQPPSGPPPAFDPPIAQPEGPQPDFQTDWLAPAQPQPAPELQQSEAPSQQQWLKWAAPVTPESQRAQQAELSELAQSEHTDPFEPVGVEFKPVSSKLITLRFINAAVGSGLALVVLVVVLLAIQLTDSLHPAWWLLVTPIVLVFGWLCWLIPRQVRAMGYAETDSELIIRKGIMWQSLVAVPYGRLQYVDVNAGPVQRWLGLTTVQLHTASAMTDADLPGIPPAEAARLRDQISERGESQLAGL